MMSCKRVFTGTIYCADLPLVSEETKASYIPIIDSILAASDLNTISEKRIRRGLETAVGHELTSQKVRPTPCSLNPAL